MSARRKTHVIPSLSRDRHDLPCCDNRAITVDDNTIAVPRQARDDKTRRELIALVGSAIAAYPAAVAAQQTTGMRRVGVLTQTGAADGSRGIAAFRQGLAALGWTEGRNLALDVRIYAQIGQAATAAAAELAARRPQVLLAVTSPAVVALRHVAGPTPIVFVAVSDPVAQGFVHDLAQPGGTITGFANYDYAMAGKWLQLLREIAPHMKRTAVLYDPKVPSWPGFFRAIQSAAKAASIDAIAVVCDEPADISHLATLRTGPSTGLIVLPGALVAGPLIQTAATLRLPAIYGSANHTSHGGLMSYTWDPVSAMRSAASYVDRILRGAKPGDLPVQDPTSFVLTINLKVAKALGLSVPQSLLVSANELIR